ncbi:Chromatin remodeling complex subunit isoform 1 [Theobroma cacao]|uniref:Chromatin remodeling complex subunit isoform 1 n=1 Tax=Theobroma cacao TaxID=3641 RepID=A0A061FLB7_THECC|nr:Chromatin remodeling complex subunit isoform 1 [Theobroma cacao]EOY17663.1 Chromatin remodeling complex subunit isoform 1 [Theobroma cacao]
MRKRQLYQSKHPFNTYPFEVLFCGSWQAVELIRIKNGVMTMHLIDDQYLIEKQPFSDFRVKSRQATLSDCTCFLRPGIDVCILSASPLTGINEENPEPVWVDAKISSIERKPHNSQCSCQFYVNLYVNQGPLGSEKVILSKETEVVGIDQISVLQRLEKHACDDQHYGWNFSEDCSELRRTKIFLGKFLSDISWLLVTSVLKRIAFDVRSVQNKIVYQILGEDDSSPLNSHNYLHAVNFKVDNGISVSDVVRLDPHQNNEAGAACSAHEIRQWPVYDAMNLRRSKRRNVQPERFLGCDSSLETDISWVRTAPLRTGNWREEEEEQELEEDMNLPLSYLFGMNASTSKELTQCETSDVCKSKNISREFKSDVAGPRKSSVNYPRRSGATNPRKHQNSLAIVPVSSESDPLASGHCHAPKFPRSHAEEVEKVSLNYYSVKRSRTTHRKKIPALEYMDYESTWKGRSFSKKGQNKSHRSVHTRKEDYDEPITYKRTTISAGAYNKLINSYMKNIDSTFTKEEPHIIDQWNQFKEAASSEMSRKTEPEQPSVEDEGDMSDTEILWREMELCMASAYFEEDEARVSAESLRKSSGNCQHDFKLDEEIGVLCRICGFVRTEIKYVSAPFLEHKSWIADGKVCSEEEPEHKTDGDEALNLFCNYTSIDTPLSEENDNVWALIPELKKKLHFHQKRAFEFLWQNVAGSLTPALMETASKKTGGCVVSHSPGAGKTLLIIAFLTSYLKLFPGKRPLVLAPKTTLYTWYKEFIKWEIPIPVHLIHGRRTYRVFKKQSVRLHGAPKPSQDVMHVLDCLEKIQKWHAQPSVLVMGYTSFLTLMREDSKFEHRKFMAKVLRESPGLLVLDEGHNPRSTKSRLRKVLMKVETDLRILLSGTLFQNNFCEYFNTLCLARPKFVYEVLRELDPKSKKKKSQFDKARNLLENRARKFFIDKIARKIDSSEGEERLHGLNMLRNITNGFIDVYEGGNSDSLPGLQIYTLMMNSTDVQHEILVKLHKIMAGYSGYPLELELLITLASIHPSLVRTSNCVNKFFSPEELMTLEKIKFDFKKGSKVMFVLNLVYRVIKKEKVLIFCHNIAPINLFIELFEIVFRWRKGREILVLTGDLELFERGRVMDKFEEPGGASRILLASITACAEGISLTAASRVILLDSEWNPSKTKQAIARAFRPGQQKVVFVYQLLATGTLEEDKYRRTTWKEWVSSMIFSEAFVEDPSRWQAEKIEDDVLREIVAEDKVKSFHMIMKNEKASTG